MHRRYYYNKRHRVPGRHYYGPGRRDGLLPARSALVLPLVLAALVVLASLA